MLGEAVEVWIESLAREGAWAQRVLPGMWVVAEEAGVAPEGMAAPEVLVGMVGSVPVADGRAR